MKRQGWVLKAYYYVKEANPKGLHTDSNSMNFWERENYGHSAKISGCQRLEGKRNE